MNYLGIDFGSKRIGIAVSDQSGSFALPLKVVENSDKAIIEVCEICKEKKIDTIVMGESKDYSFNDNNIMADIKIFVEKLKEQTGLPVILHPEFLTSAEAGRTQPRRLPSGSRLRSRELKNNMLDASAAAIILKSYLDLKRPNED